MFMDYMKSTIKQQCKSDKVPEVLPGTLHRLQGYFGCLQHPTSIPVLVTGLQSILQGHSTISTHSRAMEVVQVPKLRNEELDEYTTMGATAAC